MTHCVRCACRCTTTPVRSQVRSARRRSCFSRRSSSVYHSESSCIVTIASRKGAWWSTTRGKPVSVIASTLRSSDELLVKQFASIRWQRKIQYTQPERETTYCYIVIAVFKMSVISLSCHRLQCQARFVQHLHSTAALSTRSGNGMESESMRI